MSRNTVATPEGPGQGQSTTDITSPNAINDVFTHNQFNLPYPMYPPLYHYPLTQPLTSLLPLPPSLPQPPNTSQSTQFKSIHINQKPRHYHSNHTNNKNYNKKHLNHQKSNIINTINRKNGNNANNSGYQSQIPQTKPKTVDLSRNNSRGELETLVRWIGGDSIQIKHHCSQDPIHNEWHCVCTLPLPFNLRNNPSNILQTKARHSKKKDAIKIASKIMIKQILKQSLPIPIDIIGNDGNVTSIPAKLSQNEIINPNDINAGIPKHNNINMNVTDNVSHQSSDDDDYCSVESNHKKTNGNKSEKPNVSKRTNVSKTNTNTPFGDNEDKSVKHQRNRQCSHGYVNRYNMNRPPPPMPPPYDYDPYYGPPPPMPYHPHSHMNSYYRDWYSRPTYPPSHSYYAPYYPTQPMQTQSNSQNNRYYIQRTKRKKQNETESEIDKETETNKSVNGTDDEISTLNGDIDAKEEKQTEHSHRESHHLFEENENENETITDDIDQETDDGIINIGITPKGVEEDDVFEEDIDDEYMNELKEEEISMDNIAIMKKQKSDNSCIKKEKEGGIAVPPQRLLILVPSYVEYKTIESILPSDCERKIFSKKFNICGVSIPSNNNIDIHTPGEQNRLYIIHCGTGLVNVSLSIGIVVETVGIDAILLLGHAISLKAKSIKPGHLLLPNSVIQHDLCNDKSNRNDAIFAINYKLSKWIKGLINKISQKENETLPVMYEGILLSGSEIIKSEARITYLVKSVKKDSEKDKGIGKDIDTKDKKRNDRNVNKGEAMAVDRESISVAIICRLLKIPFVILKSIAPPILDNQIDFESYDDTCANNASFDCNASIPVVRALLKEYTMLDY